MDCIFQLLAKDGSRTEPMTCERHDFARRLKELPEEKHDDTGVLVVMEKPDDEYIFSNAPFMSVRSFIQHFGVTDNG